MPSTHLILCRPLLLLPSIFLSIRAVAHESVLHIRRPKYWSFSVNISPSNEYSGLISYRMDWLDLLVVQGTLKSLLQHNSSKASILRCSAFFIVQLSRPYMTTGKTTALTRWTLLAKAYLCFSICCQPQAQQPVTVHYPEFVRMCRLWEQAVCVCVCVCVCLGDSMGWQLVLLVAGQLALRNSLLSREITTSPAFGLSILVWQWLHLLAMQSSYRSVWFNCLHVGFLSPAAPALQTA